MSARQKVSEWVMEPGTGKAVELPPGQILRIEQVEGGQCVDFNCFNLHDYKEFMHCGRTRTVHGFHPDPRHLHVVGAAARAGDALHSRGHLRPQRRAVSALQRLCLRERLRLRRPHQLPRHPGRGAARIRPDARRRARQLQPVHVHRGDARRPRHHDAPEHQARRPRRPPRARSTCWRCPMSAAPTSCAPATSRSSRSSSRCSTATEADLAAVPATPVLRSQRTPAEFRNPTIKADRALRRDPAYVPEFPNVPIVVERSCR